VESKSKAVRALIAGGVLPVVAFTVIEEYYGILYGLIAGMIFGAGEICYEWVKQKRVELITWIGNGLILFLGAFSLFTQEGIWFKLQPALIEAGMALFLAGTLAFRKPFLLMLMQKQRGAGAALVPNLPPEISSRVEPIFKQALSSLTMRIAVFFTIHAVLATWAALYASTRIWALLKGVGFTVSMILYIVVESLVLRYKVRTIIREKV